jgi:hypothetical protein
MTTKSNAPIKKFTREQLADLVADIYRSGMVIGTSEFRARCKANQTITSFHSSTTRESACSFCEENTSDIE